MRLEEILGYEDIVIQCHDNPDADAIASGFALQEYLKSKGRSSKLVYSGPREITKRNLRLMVEMFEIPLEYLRGLEEAPDLLVTVDCRAGQGNVSTLPYQELAVIDHHLLEESEELPRLHEIRSDHGACATVLWDMLRKAGFAVEQNRRLSTALYYGLYMDTNELKNITHPLDKDMRDLLKTDGDAIARLKNANLSLNEITISGQAFASLHCDQEHRFAVAQVRPCDPNILGVVSDMVMSVDVVDVSVAYYHKPGEGVKLSVRSCLEKADADSVVRWLVRGLGDNGGGDAKKAGGRIAEEDLRIACLDDGWDDLSGAAGRLIYKRLTGYFRTDGLRAPIQLRAGDYEPTGGETLYRKKKVPVGYVPAERLFPVGTEIVIRMMEGDTPQTVTHGLCIMIGVDYEIYHTEMATLLKKYDLSEEAYPIESGYPPVVYNAATGEAKPLAAYARQCIPKDTALIRARQMDRRFEVFTKWGSCLKGESGDWLASQVSDPQDIYIIRQRIFEKTYEEAADDRMEEN